MSTYTTLSGEKRFDFRYNRGGDYINSAPKSTFIKKAKPQPRRGKVCVACGIERSVMNKCICNS